MGRPRFRALIGLAAVVTAAVGLSAQAVPPALLAGAAKQSITPFTVIPGVTSCLDSLSNTAASNPDGIPVVGLWDTFEPEVGFRSSGQVTPSGVWGEPFVDANANCRYDAGEQFTDDPVNTRLDPDSANKWDGIYLAGYGNRRIPKGAFDPIWARALYLRDPATGLGFAQVSIDVLGWFSDWNDRIVALARRINPGMDLDHLIVSHTHDHEAPDTHVGMWGEDVEGVPARDGTYPKFERYIEYKIAQAVAEAAAAAEPAKFKFGTIRPGTSFTTVQGNTEDLEGLQSRNSCRAPWVFDDEVRVMQVAAQSGGATIAALVNWGTHVEAMDSNNLYISSDYPKGLRDTVEQGLGGGVAIQVQGAQGAAEVIGDSCTRRWQRNTFDGQTFPVAADGDPLVIKNKDQTGARDRAYAIGRVAGSAAVAAATAAPWDTSATAIDGFTVQDLFVPINNTGLSALAAIGVIDKPAYVGGVSVTGAAAVSGVRGSGGGFDGKTTLYAWKIGSASFVTAPGELQPEIYLGLSTYNRGASAGTYYDYVSPNPEAISCAAAPWSYETPKGGNTGRPYEPGVRQAQTAKFGTTHNFLIGYTPDLLGYIVPGYDFAWYAAPPVHGVGLGALVGEAEDPCKAIPPDTSFPQATYGDHYQETNSAGSMFAPAYACTVWRMLGLDPATSAEGGAACAEWDAWRTGGVVHAGVEPAVCDPSGEFGDLNDCVRHY